MGWWWERSDPVFPSAARRPAIGLVAPTTAPGASVSELPGLLRAKPASSGTSRPKLAGVDNTASGLLEAGERRFRFRTGKPRGAVPTLWLSTPRGVAEPEASE